MKFGIIALGCVLSLLFSVPAHAWFPADQSAVESLDALETLYEKSESFPEDDAGWLAWQKKYLTDLEQLTGVARADTLCILKEFKADALQSELTKAEAELASLEKTLESSVKQHRPEAQLAPGDLKVATLKLKLQLYITTMNALPAHPGCAGQ